MDLQTQNLVRELDRITQRGEFCIKGLEALSLSKSPTEAILEAVECNKDSVERTRFALNLLGVLYCRKKYYEDAKDAFYTLYQYSSWRHSGKGEFMPWLEERGDPEGPIIPWDCSDGAKILRHDDLTAIAWNKVASVCLALNDREGHSVNKGRAIGLNYTPKLESQYTREQGLGRELARSPITYLSSCMVDIQPTDLAFSRFASLFRHQLPPKDTLKRACLLFSLAYTPRNPQPTNLATVIKKREVGRNDPCTCGSGKKYKKCCGVS